MEKRVTAGTSTKQELPSYVPMAVLPIVSNPDTSTTAAEVESHEDKFASYLWRSARENMPELSGPATADLMEKHMENFAKFITPVYKM